MSSPAANPRSKKIAIVHDGLFNTGGAERVVLFMHETFPDAPIFTSAYLPDRTYAAFKSMDVRPSRWMRPARTEMQAKLLFPLMIAGMRKLDLSEFDVVLSSAAYAAKAITVRAGAEHCCYCYAPFRLAWNPDAYHSPGRSPAQRIARSLLCPMLRRWDFRLAQQVSRFATSCVTTARLIEACYRRSAKIIHPPIDLSQYTLSDAAGDYYLVVSRLNPYKRVDLAIAACQQLRRNLIIVGDGPERARLERMAGDTTHFAGRVSEPMLRDCYRNSRALIFPGAEDFGMAPVEAQACGRPVIAYAAGGAQETVVDGQSGIFFAQPSADSLASAITRFESLSFDPSACRANASRFDVRLFKSQLRQFVCNREPDSISTQTSTKHDWEKPDQGRA